MVLQKYSKLHASFWFKTWDKREQYLELHIFAEDFFENLQTEQDPFCIKIYYFSEIQNISTGNFRNIPTHKRNISLRKSHFQKQPCALKRSLK